MSTVAAYAGAGLLGAATLPQFVRLARTRSVDDMTWAFVLLNFLGLTLLAIRSAAIREWAFLGINTLTATFWGAAFAVKLRSASWRSTDPAPDAPA